MMPVLVVDMLCLLLDWAALLTRFLSQHQYNMDGTNQAQKYVALSWSCRHSHTDYAVTSVHQFLCKHCVYFDVLLFGVCSYLDQIKLPENVSQNCTT